jgi:hypothetical protein
MKERITLKRKGKKLVFQSECMCTKKQKHNKSLNITIWLKTVWMIKIATKALQYVP